MMFRWRTPRGPPADPKKITCCLNPPRRPLTAADPERFRAAAFDFASFVSAHTLVASRSFAVDEHHGVVLLRCYESGLHQAAFMTLHDRICITFRD